MKGRLKMAHSCGECKLFTSAGQACNGGVANRHPNTIACADSFKAPTSLFTGNRCGCCLLFEGAKKKCGGGMATRRSATNACGHSYTPISG